MSGGHFDYAQSTISTHLQQVYEDPQVRERFPALASVLEHLEPVLYTVIKGIDYDICGDTIIQSDLEFEAGALSAIHECTKDCGV